MEPTDWVSDLIRPAGRTGRNKKRAPRAAGALPRRSRPCPGSLSCCHRQGLRELIERVSTGAIDGGGPGPRPSPGQSHQETAGRAPARHDGRRGKRGARVLRDSESPYGVTIGASTCMPATASSLASNVDLGHLGIWPCLGKLRINRQRERLQDARACTDLFRSSRPGRR